MTKLLDFPWDENDPLAPVPPESAVANAALRAYAAMGKGRPAQNTFHGIYAEQLRATGGASAKIPLATTMRGWSMNYRWVARLARFDQLENLRRLTGMRERADADRDTRIKLLEAFRGRIIKALQALDPAAANWTDVTGALRMVMQELRREYQDAEALAVAAEGLAQAAAPTGGAALDAGLADLDDAALAAVVGNLDAIRGAGPA